MKAISADRIFNHTHVHGNSLHGTFHAHSGANFHMQPVALSYVLS